MYGTEKPLVTIGIPTYNRANSFLKYSLESALGQTYSNVEIIVSDNCSTDNTKEFVHNYNDNRIKYYRHDPSIKPHENANHCVFNARGEYFLLLHDDDVIDKDFIEVCIRSIDGRDVGLVHTGARIIDENGKVKRARKNPHGASSTYEYFIAVLQGNAVTYVCNTLYKTKYLKLINGFQSKTYTYSDVVANIKIVYHYDRVEIEDPKASYRVHNSKWGSAVGIKNWCEDSLYLLDVMSELMPEYKEYFQNEGKRCFSRINYSRARRIVKPILKPYAFYIVFSQFGFTYSPLRDFFERHKESISKVSPPLVTKFIYR